MRPPLKSSAFAPALLLGLLFGLAGCVYRMPIQQGNFLDPPQVAQLETGMTRSQVMFLLGTPMVPTSFDTDRWDYYFSLKTRRLKSPVTRRLTVYFENDKVSRFVQGPDTDHAAPVASPAATPATG
ncbi:MAG TPA: outer membrane protein assembly factor BamE [Steroidobacteraceae bacterium]|jgi:outer membrane protein assembly factor BamE|nr:outer membrane protein assembly factor BamE [Steroidobacteraceae bacterium]